MNAVSEVTKKVNGAAGKVPVFSLLKCTGKDYTTIIPSALSRPLITIIERKVVPDSMVYSYKWKGFKALDVAGFSPAHINYSKRFAEGLNHINGIENFWNQLKCHARRFRRIPSVQFGLYLKECEWRFNDSDSVISTKTMG